MGMQDFTNNQQKIIKRYYENIDQISLERLSELVADLYLAEGKKRFEVLGVNQERSFLQAEIFVLEDEGQAAEPADIEAALRVHAEIMHLAGAESEQDQEAETNQLAFRLAGSLPFDPDFQQALLEMNSEAERIRALVAFFERLLPVLQRSAAARHRAGGNGHVN